jgi:hypothetical protein
VVWYNIYVVAAKGMGLGKGRVRLPFFVVAKAGELTHGEARTPNNFSGESMRRFETKNVNEITKEQFGCFVQIQRSGAVNMLDALAVSFLSQGVLDAADARTIVQKYDTLSKYYPDVIS